jgi:hypothetical protein
LLKTDAKGNVTDWQAALHGMAIRSRRSLRSASGGTGQPDSSRNLSTTTYKGLFRVVGRKELDERGAYPEALLFLEPAEGYYLADGFDQDEFLVGTTRRGAHGFMPTEPRMFTGLILSGAGIRPGVPLPSVRQIDIAPTVAKLLGFAMPNVDGVPVAGVLLPPAKPKP